MPVVMVCIHDGQDTDCANRASPGGAGTPAECDSFSPSPTNSQLAGQSGARWVEVRTCYHFRAILNMSLYSLGDFWIQRANEFTIPCYFVTGVAECG